MYAVHLADKDSFSKYSVKYKVGFLSDVFTFIDNYSPFNEILESDEELIAKLKKQSNSDDISETPNSKVKIFTPEELRKYDGSPGSPGLYIALLGVVYDVSKGKII